MPPRDDRPTSGFGAAGFGRDDGAGEGGFLLAMVRLDAVIDFYEMVLDLVQR